MNVFIDANILLSAYGLSTQELVELRKLEALVKSEAIVLWVPDQLLHEFLRNRAKVIADLLRTLRESKVKVALPAMASGLPERDALEVAVKATQRGHAELIRALEAAASSKTLPADTVILDLLKAGTSVKTSHLMPKARARRELRKPPGKAESLGDALMWEALIENVPKGEDVHLVTADGDFRSPLNDTAVDDYLASEWRARAGNGRVFLYRDLNVFSKAHFPALQLASEAPKLRAIQDLAASASFAETHAVVAKLSAFDVFSPEHARLLLAAAAENTQVRWIAKDDDVRALLRRVIDAHRDESDPNVIAILEREMHPAATDSNLPASTE